jgi:DNA-binding CsgD family transcriptional regulator
MNQQVPEHDEEGLKKRIEEKIAHISAIENDFPGVIIIHDIRDSTVVYMSKWGRDHLGVTNEELHKMGTDYYAHFFNLEDAKDYVPKILGLLERNNDDEIVSFFQQVRKSPGHDWEWYLSCTKILVRDDLHKPRLTFTTSIPIDSQHHMAAKAGRLLKENNFLRSHHHLFERLTKREKEILRLMAMGMSSAEMAESLHISETTAATHRKNVKSKLKAKTNYDISRFAQAFDLI